ncbi:MAG: carbohydrate kinase family protein [Anaerolineae bacterium]|nr:carbohydrate kinase family protein [Anaerolineae bacterium]
MIIVLGDLLADYSLRVPALETKPKDLVTVRHLELGSGGATNVAITLARFGIETACMGEVGNDLFGRVVCQSLAEEGIHTSHIAVTPGARTPVANVLVDERGEPAYLGYPGNLKLKSLLKNWFDPIRSADALFSDGWVEHDDAPSMILEAFHLAREAGVPVFFDPGPGNPRIDNTWHQEAAFLATIVVGTEEEVRRLSDKDDPLTSTRSLLGENTRLVAVKRGGAGSMLVTEQECEITAGFPVIFRDATGAGDSFDGAIIYGYLKGLPLSNLGVLANATGAAKVQKLGTGHNMPTVDEIKLVLDRFGYNDLTT